MTVLIKSEIIAIIFFYLNIFPSTFKYLLLPLSHWRPSNIRRRKVFSRGGQGKALEPAGPFQLPGRMNRRRGFKNPAPAIEINRIPFFFRRIDIV